VICGKKEAWNALLLGANWRPRTRSIACWAATGEHRVVGEPVDSQTCARESDVICTCTNSKTPLFDGDLICEGNHLNLWAGTSLTFARWTIP
jgi:ornithine cyclodeaminase/alanine dehydrogenase-like protein (mu-crystallin family)